MRYLIPGVMMILLLFASCEDTTQATEPETFNYTTANVKTGPANYFSFAANSADTVDTGAWDIAFTTFDFAVPINDTTFMTISNPYFEGAADVMIARVSASSLEEVSEVPESFSDSTYSTMLEENLWYTTTEAHIVQPLDYVYVANTADGKYPAFEITNYYDDMGNSGVFTIAWKYLAP